MQSPVFILWLCRILCFSVLFIGAAPFAQAAIDPAVDKRLSYVAAEKTDLSKVKQIVLKKHE